MNSLQNLIQRLTAIGQVTEAEEKCSECGCTPCECDDKEKVDEAKKPDDDNDGVPNWADKKPGEDDNEEKVDEAADMDKIPAFIRKQKEKSQTAAQDATDKRNEQSGTKVWSSKRTESAEVNETALNLLRKYAGILEAKIEEDEVEEGNEFSGALKAAKDAGKEEFEVGGKKYKVNECGDMPMSPMTAVPNGEPHMGIPADVMANIASQQEPEMSEPEMAVAEPESPKATYTLSIQNGENNLQMTTDVPDEIIHIMKLAGVNKGAEVSKKEMPSAGEEQEVEESGYENTPDNTKARDPQAFGDIRDWGQKGTANAKTHYTPARQGDNPMSEQRMFEDYKNFKAGK